MKIKHLLITILLTLYCYWMSDLYVFAYNNDVYDLNPLEDVFGAFKVFLYVLNYVLILVIIICIIPYDKLDDILNKEIKFKKYEN